LELAKDIKNLDGPVVSSSNPFDVLKEKSLISMAHNFGGRY
jgi:hypothetical protein